MVITNLMGQAMTNAFINESSPFLTTTYNVVTFQGISANLMTNGSNIKHNNLLTNTCAAIGGLES